jgi:hypothetical protein
MTLATALSTVIPAHKKTTGVAFFFPSTERLYRAFLKEAYRQRKSTLDAIRAHMQECFAEAQEMRKKAHNVASGKWENAIELERARRSAEYLREEAKKMRKKGRSLLKSIWRIRIHPLQLPAEFDSTTEYTLRFEAACRWWATRCARRFEEARIVRKGRTILTRPQEGTNRKFWRYQRDLVKYRDRIFLVMLCRHVEKQSHEPWLVSYVTDSLSDMSEEELRILENIVPIGPSAT